MLLVIVSTMSWSNQQRFELPRISLLTGLPDYAKFVEAPDWAQHYRMLLSREGTGDLRGSPDGSVAYNRRLPFGGGSGMYETEGPRTFPLEAPLHLIEVYDQSILEGQCAFIALTVIDFERRRVPLPFSEEQLWEYNVTRAALGCLSAQEFVGLANDLHSQRREANNRQSEHVKLSRAFAYMLRHNSDLANAMDHQNSISVRVLAEQRRRDSPFRWHPLLFVAFLLSNSKGRYRIIVKPSRDFFHHSGEVGFEIRIAANQGHTRVSSTMVEETLGASLDVARCKELGHIFHAAHIRNYESIKRDGLLLMETRQPGQTHRVTIHMVYAGGSEAAREGTHIMSGPNIFYAQLDFESFLDYGNRLYLTPNGVVVTPNNIAPMFLTFHNEPPHIEFRGSRRWGKTTGGSPFGEVPKAGSASSPFGEAAGASSSSSAAPPGSSPFGEAPRGAASGTTGSSPVGEAPVLTEEEIKHLIDLEEARSKSRAHVSYQTPEPKTRGMDLTGAEKVDISAAAVLEEALVLQRIQSNPWFLLQKGLLHLRNAAGRMVKGLSLIHISEPTRLESKSRFPSSA